MTCLCCNCSGLIVPERYGNETVPEVVSQSGYALLHFFSDAAYNLTGFNISYRWEKNNNFNSLFSKGKCNQFLAYHQSGFQKAYLSTYRSLLQIKWNVFLVLKSQISAGSFHILICSSSSDCGAAGLRGHTCIHDSVSHQMKISAKWQTLYHWALRGEPMYNHLFCITSQC